MAISKNLEGFSEGSSEVASFPSFVDSFADVELPLSSVKGVPVIHPTFRREVKANALSALMSSLLGLGLDVVATEGSLVVVVPNDIEGYLGLELSLKVKNLDWVVPLD